MGQEGRIYTTTPGGINTPDEGTATLFRNTSDSNKLYAKLPDGSSVEVGNGGSVSGYLTNNIIVPTTEAPVTLSSEETELNSIQLSYDAVVGELDFPNLTTLRALILRDTVVSGTVQLNSMTECDLIFVQENPLIIGLSFPLLTNLRLLNVKDNQGIVGINISELVDCSEVNISNEDDLVTISVAPTLNCLSFDAINCALSQVTVDDILQSLNANTQLNGSVNLSGGTSSAPSVLGNVAVLALQAKGWSVTTN